MANALYAGEPMARLNTARALKGRARRTAEKQSEGWPADSPGALNAWLLLVTTKPPSWRDPYIEWQDSPPTLGDPHQGFFYPDPLGFWAEVRHWASLLVDEPISEALTVTTLLHGATHLEWARHTMQPRIILFLDEPAWNSATLETTDQHCHEIHDPYRAGQVYEGWWSDAAGTIVGKAPQHPAAHKLYRRMDIDAFLRAAPR